MVQLTENLPINPFHLIGGSTKKKMIKSSYDMMDILVATPTVVSKLTSVKLLDMHNVRHAVLDEADTLLDDSFNGYIQNFLGKLPVCLNVIFLCLILIQLFSLDFCSVLERERQST